MKQPLLLLPVLLISSCLLFTACNGQIQTNSTNDGLPEPTDSIPAPKATQEGRPKLTKTQGSSEYINIHCSLQDQDGNLWFGTTGEGVYRYDGKSFTQFTTQDGLTNNIVWSILSDKAGNLWFGTDNGISRYDGTTVSNIPIDRSPRIPIYPGNSPDDIPSAKNEVWSIMQDRSGTIWFGTRDGVFCYNGTQFTRFLDRPNLANTENLNLKMVDDMLQASNGDIWFCSGMLPGSEGICRYDGQSITCFKPSNNGWIRTMLQDQNGNLCFATRQAGVIRYDMQCDAGKNPNQNTILEKCFTNLTDKSGIDPASVTTILEDRSGNIWIATELGSGQLGEDGGVWRYDGKTFTRFTTADGLVHNGVFSILEDKTGNIWFGTRNNGLSRYDGKTFTTFSE